MKQYQQSLDWAERYLADMLGAKVQSHQRLSDTPYSVVYKLDTHKAIFYLKLVPEELFIEAKILDFLNRSGCKHIPKLMTSNEQLQCFIMSSCGDDTLRHRFNGIIDIESLKQGVTNYTSIQRFLENKVDALLDLGLPDWRLERFPELYHQLVQQEELLANDGLTKKEIARLNMLYPVCAKLCEELAEFNLPETINHCDYHENCMLIDDATKTISIIDWGESVITHPFFSLAGILWNLAYFNNLKQSDVDYLTIQKFYFSAWQGLYKQENLLEAYAQANQLNGVYAALTYERLYSATDKQEKKVQDENKGSIAGCLQSFINEVDALQFNKR